MESKEEKIISVTLEHPDGQDWIGAAGDESIQRVLELFAKYAVNCRLTLKTEKGDELMIKRTNEGLCLSRGVS